MTIYNPVKPITLLDKASDLYWSSRVAHSIAEAAFLVAGLASVALLAVAFA